MIIMHAYAWSIDLFLENSIDRCFCVAGILSFSYRTAWEFKTYICMHVNTTHGSFVCSCKLTSDDEMCMPQLAQGSKGNSFTGEILPLGALSASLVLAPAHTCPSLQMAGRTKKKNNSNCGVHHEVA